MDVDQSIRSRHINYMNRPANNGNAGKRPLSAANIPSTNKMPRQFHIHPETGSNAQQNLEEVTSNPERVLPVDRRK